jgi:hypothetical protein
VARSSPQNCLLTAIYLMTLRGTSDYLPTQRNACAVKLMLAKIRGTALVFGAGQCPQPRRGRSDPRRQRRRTGIACSRGAHRCFPNLVARINPAKVCHEAREAMERSMCGRHSGMASLPTVGHTHLPQELFHHGGDPDRLLAREEML